MNKIKLAEKLSKKIGMSKKESIQTINEMFELITATLKKEEIVDIHGFGKFEVKKVSERNGINPKTREKIIISATNRVTFRASKSLKERIK